ncbi:leucine-rich repeat domain protein [Cotonvirus japonicus]|uniref:Leucine-rich repeat domain protein n=1 Tax=Cotonvirus japonicus TaxID=2811091 RepID=A0ABM7NSM8_9VIRU|nr:leucine-rich repeat domain protein [Cotonvirus japonicus]BCS83175.1 leucine-rich repeat domain protein [Cotonvirus japonicus]
MRVRSHRYPDENSICSDTTYYDKQGNYLDIGYQLLKYIDIKRYPEFSYLTKLFINNNSLKLLPDPKHLPKITELICNDNNLETIPYYPNLTFLNCSNNKITNCINYNMSELLYFDCSFNKNFCLNFILPYCKQLYINDTDIYELNLNFCPVLEILDCSNNALINISSGENLLELCINNNKLTNLPDYPKLLRLMADNNRISKLQTYPELLSLTIIHNNLNIIEDQPQLAKIIANHNQIVKLGTMPKLKLMDLSHNSLSQIKIPITAKYISIHFNPVGDNIIIDTNNVSTIREFQLDINTYYSVLNKYNNKINAVNVLPNGEMLEKLLENSDTKDKEMSKSFFSKFSSINFKSREQELYNLSVRLYVKNNKSDDLIKIINELNPKEFKNYMDNQSEFISLLKQIQYLYYNCIIITMYFNGYTG